MTSPRHSCSGPYQSRTLGGRLKRGRPDNGLACTPSTPSCSPWPTQSSVLLRKGRIRHVLLRRTLARRPLYYMAPWTQARARSAMSALGTCGMPSLPSRRPLCQTVVLCTDFRSCSPTTKPRLRDAEECCWPGSRGGGQEWCGGHAGEPRASCALHRGRCP